MSRYWRIDATLGYVHNTPEGAKDEAKLWNSLLTTVEGLRGNVYICKTTHCLDCQCGRKVDDDVFHVFAMVKVKPECISNNYGHQGITEDELHSFICKAFEQKGLDFKPLSNCDLSPVSKEQFNEVQRDLQEERFRQ